MHSISLSRRQALAVAACALVLIFLAARLFGASASTSPESQVGDGDSASIPALTTPDGSGSESGSVDDSGAAAPVSESTIVVVDVAGAVRRPGLYRLPQGSRIADAISRAGGMSRAADRALVNLAAPLADGEQVLVPSSVPGGPAPAETASAGPSPQSPVDLNTATAEQLDALPGVGPVTAQKIVDYRNQHGPYRSVDDLDAIPGIGPAKIANLQGLVIA
ncbi:MAG TPA: ComEA family DNA-binding protein [Gaiellaceae bacterium]|nr:ComEA family DNA-binding protein [Gaiellaceae bacterium]